MADYFVSYTSSDRAEAHWIARELETLGYVAHVHEWEIQGGEDIYAWMQARHDAADHVLCVLSDAYMAAPYSTLERNAALWAAATRPGFVLFVAAKPCKLPTLADHYRRCEIFGLPEEVARERLKTFLASPIKGAPAAWQSQLTALSNIPIRVPEHFLGRDDALAAVDGALKRYEGRVAITAVHGLRGVGKTTLAAAYAERHKHDYRATWWIRAQTPDGMRADLVALGVRLGWVAADEKEAPAFEKVEQRLRHEGEGLLLIYDNAIDADALRPFLPKGGAARVLVTSNAHAWRGLAEPVELKLWPKQIGADYFLARLGREAERADAEALSDALGGLPLAHEQAAAYCERLGVSLADYRRRFEAQPIKLLDAAKDAPAEYHDRLTVAKTFALAIEEAGKLHPAAEPLIVHAALLAPEPIPLFLFEEGREALGEPLASELADDGLEEALAALRAFALVDLENVPDERDAAVTTRCFRLHRLVRAVAAGRRPGEAARSELVGAMAAAMEASGAADDAKSWPRLRRLSEIAEALLALRSPDDDTNTRTAALCGRLATFHQFGQGDHPRSGPLFERALAIHEKTLGPDHPETAGSLNNLALLLLDRGDLADARRLYERALAIFEKALGPEHPETAAALNNLALLLRAQGDLASAQALCERALAICEQALGPEHLATAISLNGLAVLLQAQGDLAGARPLLERALAIGEKAHGPEHPDTATSLNNLAVLLQTQGEVAAVRPLLERALAIREKALGPEHPTTSRSLNSLATIVLAQGDFAAARPLFERALFIGEKANGRDHRDVAIGANNLARAHFGLGDFAAAEPLFLRAIATGDAVLGADHPLTHRFRANYARLLTKTSRAGEALRLAEAALSVHSKSSGPNHPWTQDSARAVAEALGRAEEAAAIRQAPGV